MAQIEFEDHLFSEDEIYVSKDDGTKRRRFTDRDEAEEYYEYLKREEVQDCIAKNQAEAVAQNKKIIDNQERLIKSQEHNRFYPHQNSTRQILDPEVREWIQFQKETSPEYKKWKREKEVEAERIRKRQEEEAERLRIKIEIQERERREKEIARIQKQEEELKENQRAIESLVSSLLQRKKLSWEQRCQIAKYTNNKSAIKKLKYDNSIKVLDALLLNPYIDSTTIQHIHNRKKDKIDSKIAYQALRSKKGSGCLIIVILLLVVGYICY